MMGSLSPTWPQKVLWADRNAYNAQQNAATNLLGGKITFAVAAVAIVAFVAIQVAPIALAYAFTAKIVTLGISLPFAVASYAMFNFAKSLKEEAKMYAEIHRQYSGRNTPEDSFIDRIGKYAKNHQLDLNQLKTLYNVVKKTAADLAV